MKRESWRGSEGERRVGWNREKDIIYREGEKGREGEKVFVCLGMRYREGITKRHKYKYRYYIVLYNQPRSISSL